LQFSRCSDIGQSFAPIGLHKTDVASDWLLKKHYFGKKGFVGAQVQKLSDYITVGVILAFTGKKMLYFNQKSEVPLKNSKTSRGPC
jgi:hypothetical protein